MEISLRSDYYWKDDPLEIRVRRIWRKIHTQISLWACRFLGLEKQGLRSKTQPKLLLGEVPTTPITSYGED
ncbi:MAG: hypothetical protein AB7F59_03240 [Bdellovibrionales bacterium]